MTILYDIDYTKKKQNDSFKTENELWDLEKYINVAKRCIGTFAYGNVAHVMLNSEDAISYIAEQLMCGHCKWENGKGRTLKSYLNQYAIWGIHRWVICMRKEKKHISLNDIDDNEYSLLNSIQDDKAKEPLMNMINAEAVETILEHSDLTDRQRKCIKLVYVDGHTQESAGKILNISRQAVNQYIQNGFKKVRIKCGTMI